MQNKFKAKVNKNQTFELSEKDVLDLDLLQIGQGQFHLLYKEQSLVIELLDVDFFKKTYTLKINGSEYLVELKDQLDNLIDKMGFSLANTKQVDELKAPMPGLILSINIKQGDRVKEDDQLLVLEAMKMENSLLSPRSGLVKSILVKNGDPVEKGQVLLRFENEEH